MQGQYQQKPRLHSDMLGFEKRNYWKKTLKTRHMLLRMRTDWMLQGRAMVAYLTIYQDPLVEVELYFSTEVFIYSHGPVR